jgi:hypothetical protein
MLQSEEFARQHHEPVSVGAQAVGLAAEGAMNFAVEAAFRLIASMLIPL